MTAVLYGLSRRKDRQAMPSLASQEKRIDGIMPTKELSYHSRSAGERIDEIEA